MPIETSAYWMMMMSRARASHQILVLPAMLEIETNNSSACNDDASSLVKCKKCSPVRVPHSNWRAHLVMRRSATFS